MATTDKGSKQNKEKTGQGPAKGSASPSFIKVDPDFEDTTSFSSEPQLPKRKKVYKWKRTLMRIPLILFWLVLLWLGAKIVWRESRHAESTSAMLVGNIIQIRAPFTTELSELMVKEGDVVDAGQVVARLDASHLEHQITLLQELKRTKEREPAAIELELFEETQRVEQFTEASLQRENMLRTRIEQLTIEVEFAKDKEDRLQEAYDANTIPYIDVAEAVSIRRSLEKEILFTEQQILLQHLITSNARNGRLFTESFQIIGNTAALNSEMTSLASEISEIEMEARAVQKQMERFRLTSPRRGRVFSVTTHAGAVVRSGEPLMSVEAENEILALGWFKFDEAQKIGFDTEAEIILPALKASYPGRVISIGEAALIGLEAFGSLQPPSAAEVPIKIRFQEQVPGLRTGLRARIRIRHDDPL